MFFGGLPCVHEKKQGKEEQGKSLSEIVDALAKSTFAGLNKHAFCEAPSVQKVLVSMQRDVRGTRSKGTSK